MARRSEVAGAGGGPLVAGSVGGGGRCGGAGGILEL